MVMAVCLAPVRATSWTFHRIAAVAAAPASLQGAQEAVFQSQMGDATRVVTTVGVAATMMTTTVELEGVVAGVVMLVALTFPRLKMA